MAKDFLKSFGIGVAVTVVLLAIATFGVHTPLQLVTLPFVILLAAPASVVAYEITKGNAGSMWETIQLNVLMILFGGLIFGFVAFLILQRRKNSK